MRTVKCDPCHFHALHSTGNVGIHGGNTGAREETHEVPFERMPTLDNPVQTSISMFMWTDAIERGPK